MTLKLWHSARSWSRNVRNTARAGYQWAQFGAGENEMTVEQIQTIEDRGAQIAKGMQQLGFKAFEINAAGFNMGEHFLSRFYNVRTDEYGCTSLENRARFVTECITKIKEACGSNFNVQILIDAIEENDNVANNPTLMTLDNAVTTPRTKLRQSRKASPLRSCLRPPARIPCTCA